MSGRYELVIATATGWYPVLTACSPTSRIDILQKLSEVVTEVRQGRGSNYELIVCEVASTGYTQESMEEIASVRRRLK
jgi:hypothetical protein